MKQKKLKQKTLNKDNLNNQSPWSQSDCLDVQSRVGKELRKRHAFSLERKVKDWWVVTVLMTMEMNCRNSWLISYSSVDMSLVLLTESRLFCSLSISISTGHLGQILHDKLHWLEVPTRCSSSWQWQFIGVWTAEHHRTCRTAASRSPVLTLGGVCVPPTVNYTRYRLNTYGRRAFSVAGPTVCNSLPDFIRDPTISGDCFRRLLKTYLFARY